MRHIKSRDISKASYNALFVTSFDHFLKNTNPQTHFYGLCVLWLLPGIKQANVKPQRCDVRSEFAPTWKIQTIFLAHEELHCPVTVLLLHQPNSKRCRVWNTCLLLTSLHGSPSWPLAGWLLVVPVSTTLNSTYEARHWKVLGTATSASPYGSVS